MRSMRRHDGAVRDASPPPCSRPAKWIADSLETIWLAAQDHRLVPVVPGDRFRSRALAYGKPCASQRCPHGLGGGVGTSSAEVFHAYPTETLARQAQRVKPGPHRGRALPLSKLTQKCSLVYLLFTLPDLTTMASRAGAYYAQRRSPAASSPSEPCRG
jgi:hypothetical protein